MVTCADSIAIVDKGQDLLVFLCLIVFTPDRREILVQLVALHFVGIFYNFPQTFRCVAGCGVFLLVLNGIDLVVGQRVGTPVQIDAREQTIGGSLGGNRGQRGAFWQTFSSFFQVLHNLGVDIVN